jgi:predicted GNAT family acetyltransferase
MTVDVRDEPSASRYEVRVDGELAGFTDYRLRPDRIAFTHTEVLPEFSGRGLARRLVAEELDDARRRGLAVLPFCPLVRAAIADDPGRWLDLVRPQDRARFDLPSAAPSAPPVGE